MKLYEAIRLGATMSPQVKFLFNSPQGTCALGAALEAVGLLRQGFSMTVLHHHFPISETYATHPLLGKEDVVANIIMDLNDCRNWSREAIAAWLEPIEEAACAATTVTETVSSPSSASEAPAASNFARPVLSRSGA